MGPTIPVTPGPNKAFEAFSQDQALCRQFADGQIGGPQQAQTVGANQTLVGAGVGAALGAGAGALLGGGRGAAVGAGIGGTGGALIGASQANQTATTLQRRYDLAYAQCMYSRGNQVQGFAPPAPPPGPPVPPPPKLGTSPGNL